jgi:pyruvate/2-oxoglutarate dehydrogenase complex dihydrolipoamide dehydrogenase (E3) component
MTNQREYDLVVVGGGSAGLTATQLAARLDARVLLVERHRLGGDCLWTGCVPSKTLIASANAAQAARSGQRFGFSVSDLRVDLHAVWDRIRRVQQTVASADDNDDAYESLGVDVQHGTARFGDVDQLVVAGVDGEESSVHFKHALIATGSSPRLPEIEGVVDVADEYRHRVLTSDSLFAGDPPGQRVVVVGSGPVAVEIAQALHRLDCNVTWLVRGERLLQREDADLAARLQSSLVSEGLVPRCNVELVGVHHERSGARCEFRDRLTGDVSTVEADSLIFAIGRSPNLDLLDLDAAGVRYSPSGVTVDKFLRSTNPCVYAAGDVAGRWQFTHAAGYEGAIAVRNMFFPATQTADTLMSWATFSDPELAHVGLTNEEAHQLYGESAVDVLDTDLAHNDRARADDRTEGLVRLVVVRKKIVGAHVLAPHAGENIAQLAMAIREGYGPSDLAGLLHVYPTYSSSIHKIGADVGFERASRLKWLRRVAR